MGIIILENIYSELADWEAEGRPGGSEERIRRIGQSARDVVPAVVTAVTTTIVSFLPVFFLTGRDYRLFSPLAWTKTFALASALIVAVTVVPMLCRVFLVSRRPTIWRSLITSLGFAGIVAALCWLVWNEHLPKWTGYPLAQVTVAASIIAFLVAWWMGRESIRPMESNPVSRFVRLSLIHI